PFGSATNALALNGNTLFAANGGNNAVAQIRLGDSSPSKVEGFIPAGWYPGAIVTDGNSLFIANVKGIASRRPKPNQEGWGLRSFQGTIGKVTFPNGAQLAAYTEQVRADARVPQTLAAWEKSQSDVKPVAVPKHAGEPSVFEHVVYVIKENRTYD